MVAFGGVSKVADTGNAGVAAINGTPTILSWTAPNDGKAHIVIVAGGSDCTVAATGGTLQANGTLPDGSSANWQMLAGSPAVGAHNITAAVYLVESGSTFNVVQSAALTAGALTYFVQLWAA